MFHVVFFHFVIAKSLMWNRMSIMNMRGPVTRIYNSIIFLPVNSFRRYFINFSGQSYPSWTVSVASRNMWYWYRDELRNSLAQPLVPRTSHIPHDHASHPFRHILPSPGTFPMEFMKSFSTRPRPSISHG